MMIDLGYHGLLGDEKEPVHSHNDFINNFEEFLKQIHSHVQYTYSRMLTTFHTIDVLTRTSAHQWSTYLTNHERWMGNFAIADGSRDYSQSTALTF